MDSLYCSIFVDGVETGASLARLVAQAAGGDHAGRDMVAPWAAIGVVRNPDFDSTRARADRDGFLFYRFKLEIDQEPGCARARFVAQIGRLLEALWAGGWRAVAACEFEDELPRRGGYRWRGHGEAP